MNCRSYHGENYYQKKRIFFSFFIRLEKKHPLTPQKKPQCGHAISIT